MEIFGFAREMSGQTTQLVGQMQAQAQAYQDQNQNQINLMLAQAEAHKQEALKREETQRAEALKREEAQRIEAQILRTEAIRREEMSLAREQMMAKMKAGTEQALRKEKTNADEATRKREQLYMEHELKRQKVMVEANTTLQQERIKADVHREVAHMEALERMETEFRQQQEREREQARNAQLKLRELAAKELKERVHLERELVRQQQQNVILQKQREVDRLEAQVHRQLFQQAQESAAKPVAKVKLASVREEAEMYSTEIEELTEPDTPPSSQNRPRVARRILPTVVDVDVQTCRTVVSEPPTLNVGLVEQGQGLGALVGYHCLLALAP